MVDWIVLSFLLPRPVRPGRFWPSLFAIRAQAFKINREIHDLESGPTGIGKRNPAENWIVKIDYLIAPNTYQVVVVIDIAVESGHRCNMTGFSGNPEIDKSLQGAVHRGTRYPGDSIFDVLIDLIDGRMILAVQQRLENRSTLHRHWYPPLATLGLKTADLLLPI